MTVASLTLTSEYNQDPSHLIRIYYRNDSDNRGRPLREYRRGEDSFSAMRKARRGMSRASTTPNARVWVEELPPPCRCRWPSAVRITRRLRSDFAVSYDRQRPDSEDSHSQKSARDLTRRTPCYVVDMRASTVHARRARDSRNSSTKHQRC